jgi:4-hydroxybenzoate polyprenyltransferase
MPSVVLYLRLLRPKQWIKNLFVFAPLIFAKELFMVRPLLVEVKALIAFCLMASAVYIINDIADADADRTHPEKKNRPLAARSIPISHAYVLVFLLLTCLIVLVNGMDGRFMLVLVSYFLMNVAYSVKLKEVVLLDVFIIAAGFMLRVLGGAYAIDVAVSSWLVLCTMFISLFLGFAKRRSELVMNQESEETFERKVLSLYSVSFIDHMLTIAAAGTVISYALYTVAQRTIEIFGTEKMIYTTVFVLFGVFRYLYLIHMTGSTQNPTKAVTSDLTILATGLLWIISCIILIYAGGKIDFIAQ